jgi:flagellar biogenesis protein FliO
VHEQPARELAVLLQLALAQQESLQRVSVALAQLVLAQQESLQPVLTLESVEFQP